MDGPTEGVAEGLAGARRSATPGAARAAGAGTHHAPAVLARAPAAEPGPAGASPLPAPALVSRWGGADARLVEPGGAATGGSLP